MNTDLDEILLNLWNNWMFRLSLSSNELFHSNTLQYLAEILALENEKDAHPNDCSEKAITGARIVNPKSITPKAVSKLFKITDTPLESELDGYTNFTIERERNNLDLLVLGHKERKSSPILAIEVKVKSYPTLKQLEEYKAKLGNTPLVLLTGMGCDVTENIHSISFEKLGNSLYQQFSNKHNPLASSYIELCFKLDSLFKYLQTKLNPELTLKESMDIADKLELYRLHSIWWKLWASHIENRIREDIKKCPRYSEYENYFSTHNDFTKKGNVGAYFKWKSEIKNDERKIELGVQIEGKSFRLFLSIADPGLGNADQARSSVEKILLDLFQNKGIFSKNPANANYREYICSRKKMKDTVEKWDIFKEGIFSAPRGDKFKLPGYANSPGNGFSDFRLTLKDKCKISEIVKTVIAVLDNNTYSISDNGSLVLLEVVKTFQNHWEDELKKHRASNKTSS